MRYSLRKFTFVGLVIWYVSWLGMSLAGRVFSFTGEPGYREHPYVLDVLIGGLFVSTCDLFNPFGYGPFYWTLTLLMYGSSQLVKRYMSKDTRITSFLLSWAFPLLGFAGFFCFILLWQGGLILFRWDIIVSGPWILLFDLLSLVGFWLGLLLMTASFAVKPKYPEILALADWVLAAVNFSLFHVILNYGSYIYIVVHDGMLGLISALLIIFVSTGLLIGGIYQLSQREKAQPFDC